MGKNGLCANLGAFAEMLEPRGNVGASRKCWSQNPAGSWNIHIFSVPTQIFTSIAFICAEKMNISQADTSNGLT